MDRLIYTAMSGASQTLLRQAAVAHNLANVATDGYRAEEQRLRAVEVLRQGESGQTALPTRAFVVSASTHTSDLQGPLNSTGRELDIAVKGQGMIAVQLPDGTEAYTRAGSLTLGNDGTLQTLRGHAVVGDGGPIAIPAGTLVSIGGDGTISAVPETGNRRAVEVIGRIKLVNPGQENIVRQENGLFGASDGQPFPASETVNLVSGYVEGSNVNAAEQMVSMISLARQFELQLKMLSTADANDKAASQILATR